MRCRKQVGWIVGALLVMALPVAAANLPTARRVDALPQAEVDGLQLPVVDFAVARAEDQDMLAAGDPQRFALPEDVDLSPATAGTWEEFPAEGLALWRLRIAAPGCLSLGLGFERFRLPVGGRLVLHAAAGEDPPREFTHLDNADHGQLWTPVVLGDELVIEMTLPLRARDDYELWLTRVGKGYRFFGETDVAKAGACNVDVVCPEGDLWRNEIAAVGVYTIGAIWKCSGTLVNNTAEDGTPYFLTAAHCGVTEATDHAVVLYWNFESPVCGAQSGGSLTDFQTGTIHRATWGGTDCTLLELSTPPNPLWGLAWAGWSREDVAPVAAVCIHHPSTDEKSISFEYDPTQITSNLGTVSPGDGNFLRIVDWDLGTTEPGSSGASLFDPQHRVVGQLYGGYAACGNDLSDWYGRIAVSWEGGGTPATRLRDWLDPLGTAQLTVDTYAPGASGMTVSPQDGLTAQGDPGGPFTPDSVVYTVEAVGGGTFDFQVTSDMPWVTVNPASGTLAAGQTLDVTVALGAAAAGLPIAFHEAVVTFTNVTDGVGDAQRTVLLQVGTVGTRYVWTLDDDPGWQTEGDWAWGVPLGVGGSSGSPDPTSGFTGDNVLGYNLAGDYVADMPEMSLTSGPIDCSDLQAVSLRFRRWLGVETNYFDHAHVRASNDGLDWTTIWTNSGEVADATWQEVTYDLSAVADGSSTLFVRWVMGTTDEGVEYCGWNLDDIEIIALGDGTVGIAPPDDTELPSVAPGKLAVRAWPNPFNPQTTVAFDVPRPQQVRVTVHDVSGRKLRVLHDGPVAAGTRMVTWDGRDTRGRRLASGVYFVHVAGTYQATTLKLSLLK